MSPLQIYSNGLYQMFYTFKIVETHKLQTANCKRIHEYFDLNSIRYTKKTKTPSNGVPILHILLPLLLLLGDSRVTDEYYY